ncbi:transcription elongation factor GreA [PVC group bacterium (ex Bugula neritina AB1)]|nr:transcription elongation factor GreA [PVC group bacterium (ex Bugula neritina AB1)]
MEKVYLSQKGYNNLKTELDNLKTNVRPQLSKKIELAREHGDLKENAEYHAAREEQGLAEARINEIQDKLARAKIVDNEEISTDAIYIGSTVTLYDQDMDSEIIYTLVSEDEASITEGKISISSPVGKSLLGHKVDDTIEIEVPARTISYKVIKIERL